MRKKTKEEFIDSARKIHGDKFDYSKVNYTGNKNHVTIICPKGHEFSQKPNSHLNGRGCNICRPSKHTWESFLSKAKEVHSGKYQYPEKMESMTSPLNILCPEHGVFSQTPESHLQAKGCPSCAKNRNHTFDSVKEAAEDVHKGNYSYIDDGRNFTRHGKMLVVCEAHGVFEQIIGDHLRGHGCSKCASTNSKQELEFFEFINDLVPHEVLRNYKGIPGCSEVDVFVPRLNLAFEFNGLYWHSSFNDNVDLNVTKNRHLKKTEACAKSRVRLVHIFEDDWLFKKEILISFIQGLLNINQVRVYGRNTELKQVSYNQAKTFLDENHIQGSATGQFYLGAFSDDGMVSCSVFSKNTLVRHCNKLNYRVIGSLGKAVSWFKKHGGVSTIETFCDNSMFTGESYEAAGFHAKNTIPPDYRYVFKRKRQHKFGFRHKYLPKKLKNYDPTLSEYINCKNNGVHRIYDCGKTKYVLDF